MKKLAVFCDFDGTITEKDNISEIMKRFGPPEFESLKEAVLSQKISIQEGVGKMFSLLPSSLKEEIVQYVKETAVIRKGFKEFVAFLKQENIPFYVVSGGMDFFVHPILQPYGIFDSIFCNSANFSKEQIKILWPHSCDNHCSNGCGCCKPSVMRKFEKDDFFKVVIGDSITDLQAAKQADYIIARDFLAQKCEELELKHATFENFFDCIQVIKDLKEV